MSIQGASPDKFIADYGGAEFPHRDELFAILRNRAFREFYSIAELEGDGRPSLTCLHYAEIYRFRSQMMAKRLRPSSELNERLRDFRHLYMILDRSPDEPCELYLCVMSDLQYAIFCRPTLHDVAGCFVSRTSSVPCPWCGALVRDSYLNQHKTERCPKAPAGILASRPTGQSKPTRGKRGKQRRYVEKRRYMNPDLLEHLRHMRIQRDSLSD